jgi:VanZ family protein
MPRLPRHPAVWFSALVCWFALLWFLSSMHGSPDIPPPFPHFDKLMHFGYFLIGGFLLTGGIYLRNPDFTSWKPVLVTTIAVMAAVGIIDEWHQCFTPGRSGADPWDWLADVLGGSCGAFLLKAAHRRLQ